MTAFNGFVPPLIYELAIFLVPSSVERESSVGSELQDCESNEAKDAETNRQSRVRRFYAPG